MSKKTIIKITLLTILSLLLLVIIYFLFFYDFSQKKNNLTPINKNKNIGLTNSADKQINHTDKTENETIEQKNTTKNKDDMTEFNLKKKALFFTERFGTYSNQSNFKNIKDLKMFMTEDMKKWADNFIAEQSNIEYSGGYSGVTVKAVKTEVLSLDEDNGFAVIIVDAQKMKSDTNGDNKPIMTKLRINFINDNGKWLVNKAVWQ